MNAERQEAKLAVRADVPRSEAGNTQEPSAAVPELAPRQEAPMERLGCSAN